MGRNGSVSFDPPSLSPTDRPRSVCLSTPSVVCPLTVLIQGTRGRTDDLLLPPLTVKGRGVCGYTSSFLRPFRRNPVPLLSTLTPGHSPTVHGYPRGRGRWVGCTRVKCLTLYLRVSSVHSPGNPPDRTVIVGKDRVPRGTDGEGHSVRGNKDRSPVFPLSVSPPSLPGPVKTVGPSSHTPGLGTIEPSPRKGVLYKSIPLVEQG